MQQNHHVVIIGNGIAGVTLAQHLRRNSKARITLISAESATHFSRTALMYVYMGHMRYQDLIPYADWYWREQQLELVHGLVEQIDFTQKQLQLRDHPSIAYDTLVLATGSCPAFYNWPGQQLKGVQGLVTLQDLELMEQTTQGIRQAVVVGGGLIGIEMAEMLKSRNIEVTMLVREKLYWQRVLPQQEATMITAHIASHGIQLLLQEELQEIMGDEAGAARAVITKSGKEIPCQFVGLATGVKPNIAFLQDTPLELETGILVNEYFETNLPDVYAIGDCAQFRKPAPGAPAVEQLWYTGRQHGEALAGILLGQRQPYNRGPWFNSAKFLDVEYQTYGVVPALWDETLDTLYWQHEKENKAVRLVYERETEKLVGINLLGIRYRHDLCHLWLQHRFTLEQVLPQLPAANFDPEFHKRYEPDLWEQYLQKFPGKAAPKPDSKSSWWNLRAKLKLAIPQPD